MSRCVCGDLREQKLTRYTYIHACTYTHVRTHARTHTRTRTYTHVKFHPHIRSTRTLPSWKRNNGRSSRSLPLRESPMLTERCVQTRVHARACVWVTRLSQTQTLTSAHARAHTHLHTHHRCQGQYCFNGRWQRQQSPKTQQPTADVRFRDGYAVASKRCPKVALNYLRLC